MMIMLSRTLKVGVGYHQERLTASFPETRVTAEPSPPGGGFFIKIFRLVQPKYSVIENGRYRNWAMLAYFKTA